MNLSSLQPEVDTPFTASLTDPAVGVAVVTWFWEISPDGVTGWASLDGAASDTYTPVIGDVASYLRVTVDYDDGEGPGKRAQATPDHEVHESHPDNHAPEFTSTETGERSVDENTPAGTAIGLPVAATDEHHVDVLTYSLSGSDADDFEIVRTLGQLLTGAPLDHEARDTYSVIVRGHGPVPRVRRDRGDRHGHQRRGARNGQAVVRAASGRRNVRFRPVRPGRRGVGPVVGLGEIGGPDELERNSRSRVELVHARSGRCGQSPAGHGVVRRCEGAGKSAQAVSANPVQEPVDHAPTFDHTETGVRRVAENTPPGTDIGEPFTAIDADGHTLTYFLLDTPDASHFDIDASSGQLRTGSPLDHETRRLYSLTVAVHDSGEGHDEDGHAGDATLAVTVIVTDVDEGLPPGLCVDGGSVENSEDNSGLASDCETLLGVRDDLAGEAILDLRGQGADR